MVNEQSLKKMYESGNPRLMRKAIRAGYVVEAPKPAKKSAKKSSRKVAKKSSKKKEE